MATITISKQVLNDFIDDNVSYELTEFTYNTMGINIEWNHIHSDQADVDYDVVFGVNTDFTIESDDYVEAKQHAQLQAEHDQLLLKVEQLETRIQEQADVIALMTIQAQNQPTKKFRFKFW